MWVIRNAHRILVEKSEGKKPLAGFKPKCEDNIKTIKEIMCEDAKQISLDENEEYG
jgi:hypothetical protein